MDPIRDRPGERVWLSPLLLPALAVTAGVALDRAVAIPLHLALVAGAVFVCAAALARGRLALVYLLVALAGVGAAFHQWRCQLVQDDDIAFRADDETRPVRLRGVLIEEPRRTREGVRGDRSLSSQPAAPVATALLRCTHLVEASGDRAVSGNARMVMAGQPGQATELLFADLHPGDEIEVIGRLSPIRSPGNPGEFDMSRYWSAYGVRVTLRVRPEAGNVKRLREGWQTSPRAWFALARGRAHQTLDAALPDESTAALARALLLGEGAPMTNDDWAKYIRTGVVHVLAISGQHLVVLAYFFWLVLFRAGLRQRQAALLIAAILLGYALLTGGKAPALRAAVICCAFCFAIVLRRPALPANLLALAWLIVVAVNPATVFDPGCQLSFLAVATLAWCVPWFFPEAEPDPLEELIDAARPAWLRGLRWLAWIIVKAYLINLLVWLTITPLAAYHTGMVAPAALVLGPPLTLFTSLALLLGFILLGLSAVGAPHFVISKPLAWSLELCERLVDLADHFATHRYLGEVPLWWVMGFYVGLFALFTIPSLLARWRRLAPAGMAWLCLLLVTGTAAPAQRDFRCIFLDVGHGGCTVLRMPDGRVMLFDTGAMRGPDITARTIAPALWRLGITRVDDILVSHADLDHFNGLPGVVERFAVGRLLLAESFTQRRTAGVEFALEELKRRGVAIEHLSAGDHLGSGGVSMEVLHPPRGWTGRNANENSLTLLVSHASNTLLLTGDLEGSGLQALLRQPARRVDVLQAPHHGSGRVEIAPLLRWCRPRLAISCQGAPVSGRTGQGYTDAGVPFWTTWHSGAITVVSNGDGLHISAHRDSPAALTLAGEP